MPYKTGGGGLPQEYDSSNGQYGDSSDALQIEFFPKPKPLNPISSKTRNHIISGVFDKNGHLLSGAHYFGAIERIRGQGDEVVIDSTEGNGVILAHIPSAHQLFRTKPNGQTFFPKGWSPRDIMKAALDVYTRSKDESGTPKEGKSESIVNGVNVAIYVRKGMIKTCFPTQNQPEKGEH
jgi:hypothetical protein